MAQGEVIPQVLVFQEFEQTPAELTDPLRAFVAGPCYALFRESEASEKALIGVGQYDPVSETCHLWPNKPAGAVVDQDFAKVFMDDALLKYFEDGIGLLSTITAVGATTPNHVRSDTVNWKTFGAFARDAVLLDRDVAVGDIVNLRTVVATVEHTLRTNVTGFVNDKIDSIIAASAADAGNQAATSLDADINQTAGATNEVEAAIDGSSYDGRAAGDVSETYFIEVIKASIGSDATTGELRVTSASGNDNQASITPSDFGVATPIGTRGLDVTFDLLGVSSGGVPIDQDDFVVGQKWTATVTQAHTPSTSVSNTVDPYLGAADTTYIVEVTLGGAFAASPQVNVTTSTGIDSSGPHVVPASGSEIAIGTLGVTITFTGDGLVNGDKYTIVATAEADGAIKTLVLGKNLPTEMITGSPDLELKLYIQKDIEVNQDRVEAPPLQNWTTSVTELCTQPGITSFDSSWTDSGVLVPLPVLEGEVFIEYRALKAEFQDTVQSLSDVSLVAGTLGPVDPANPLAFGVFKALENSNGTTVRFMNTDNTLAGHSAVIDKIFDRRDLWGLVPLTFDANIQDLYAAHVKAASTAERATWRTAWVSTEAEEVKSIVDTASGGGSVLATITDDPDTSGTQFTIVTAVGELFLDQTNPVRPGDILRTLYVDDGFGNLTFTEFVIDAVINNEVVRLVSGPASAVTTPSKIEIHRNLTKNEIADDIAITSGAFGDRRVRNIWPDTVGVNDVDVAGYFLAAGLAGLRSGVVPHQGLTNVEVAGFDDLSRTTVFFNDNQLTTMAAAGTWIVTQADAQALNPGSVFTRQQLTTDTSTIENGEDTFVSNPDSISFVYFKRLSIFIGRTNVTPSNINRIRTEIDAITEFLKSAGFSERLGGQITDATLLRLVQHPTLKDRLIAEMTIDIPAPVNNIEMRIVFG